LEHVPALVHPGSVASDAIHIPDRLDGLRSATFVLAKNMGRACSKKLTAGCSSG
jgi:hypothetical protein